jgi:hypothetical protein
VTRSWTLATLIEANRGRHSPPWTCQLIHADADEVSVALDLVALEPCPVYALGCPRFTPFTMHLVRGTGASQRQWDELLSSWLTVADVVTLMVGETDGLPWLCMSANSERHLVLELPRRSGQAREGRDPTG